MTIGTNWTLDLGDFRHAVSGLPRVDHLITDPPYSKGLYSRTQVSRGVYKHKDGYVRGKSSNKAEVDLADLKIGDAESIVGATAQYCAKNVRRWAIIFHDDDFRQPWIDAMAEAGFRALRTAVWLKTDPMPQISGDRPAQDVEYFTCFHKKGRARWSGGGKGASIVHGRAKGRDRPDHPSPKPVPVMNHLLARFTDPGELVLDPFAGSGTTGVSCLQMGRRFHGVERNQEFHQLASERLRRTEDQYAFQWNEIQGTENTTKERNRQ